MMLNNYIAEQFHERFRHYLMEKFVGDINEVNSYLETAENVLPSIFEKYFNKKYVSVYDLQDVGEIDDLRKKITADPILKNIDRNEEPRYTEVLKWYRRFIRLQHDEPMPMPVPGEYGSTPVNVDKNPKELIKHDDANYAPDTEGVEHQYNLTKKERNPELRQKCIEYYKQMWNGHIRCLCCGFDFGKAYENIGEGYIEIHHVNPHHTFEGEHMVDPLTDLIPLCSNCHSMIHRVNGAGKCMTLDDLKKLYKGKKYSE